MDTTTNQPVPNVQQPTVQPVQQPISGRKEAPASPSKEWITPSTPEVVLPQEVKEAGVETKTDFPQLTPEQKAAGLQVAKEATEVKPLEQTALNTKTPRATLEILKRAHKKVTEGFSWLVRLIIKEQDKKEQGGVS